MRILLFITLVFIPNYLLACPISLNSLNDFENTSNKKYIEYITTLKSHPIGTAFYLKSEYIELQKSFWIKNFILGCGIELAKSNKREDILTIIKVSSLKSVQEEDFQYIKEWLTIALENNPYETMIALRRIYKENMFFYDKNVEEYLKNLYQEEMFKY